MTIPICSHKLSLLYPLLGQISIVVQYFRMIPIDSSRRLKDKISMIALFGNLFNPYVSNHSLSPEDPVVLSGNSPPRVPDWKVTLSYSHDFIFNLGLLTPRIVLKASDSYFLDIYNRDQLGPGVFDSLPNGGNDLGVQKSYNLFDLSLIYQPNSKNWTLGAYIHNATDENVKVDSGNAMTSAGLVATYMEPRTYQIKFSYLFNEI